MQRIPGYTRGWASGASPCSEMFRDVQRCWESRTYTNIPCDLWDPESFTANSLQTGHALCPSSPRTLDMAKDAGSTKIRSTWLYCLCLVSSSSPYWPYWHNNISQVMFNQIYVCCFQSNFDCLRSHARTMLRSKRCSARGSEENWRKGAIADSS